MTNFEQGFYDELEKIAQQPPPDLGGLLREMHSKGVTADLAKGVGGGLVGQVIGSGLGTVGGAALGGYLGHSLTEDPEKKKRNAILAALGGGVGGYALGGIAGTTLGAVPASVMMANKMEAGGYQ